MEKSEDYPTQIGMNLWERRRAEVKEHLKYCYNESCSREISQIIPLNIAGLKFYLGVCDHHLKIIESYSEYVSTDFSSKIDIANWEPDYHNNELPELTAIPQNNGQTLKVYCKFCDVYHSHGGEGHKVAHCGGRTPYSEHGYIVKIKSKN